MDHFPMLDRILFPHAIYVTHLHATAAAVPRGQPVSHEHYDDLCFSLKESFSILLSLSRLSCLSTTVSQELGTERDAGMIGGSSLGVHFLKQAPSHPHPSEFQLLTVAMQSKLRWAKGTGAHSRFQRNLKRGP